MRVCDINPYVRLVTSLHYDARHNTVKVTDCRIFYIEEGTASLYIGEQHYRLHPHCLFYCCAGSEYTIETQEGVSLICINFDLTQAHNDMGVPFPPCSVREEWSRMPVFFQGVTDSPFLNGHLHLPNAEGLYRYLEELIMEFSADSRFGKELRSAALKMLLTQLHCQGQTALPPKIEFVQRYIQKNYMNNITNKELATLVGYHEYYFNRVFTAHTGISLHGYLLKVRLSRASFLILNTDMELTAIPEQVGFKSYPHFSSYFKQAYGYSPAQYRKHLKGSI